MPAGYMVIWFMPGYIIFTLVLMFHCTSKRTEGAEVGYAAGGILRGRDKNEKKGKWKKKKKKKRKKIWEKHVKLCSKTMKWSILAAALRT